jgi:surface polysaccharide O-acyltransferase-like enzyme
MTKSIYIDQMRVVATISVVILHVSSDGLYYYDASFGSAWFAANIIDSLVRFSVPLFVMISGVLLFPKQIGFYTFIQKRLRRILLPFVLWWSIYLIMNVLFVIKNSGVAGLNFHFLYEQLVEGSSYHLWYVYMIIGVYLMLPITSKALINKSTAQLSSILMIWVGLLLLLTYIPELASFTMPFLLLKLAGYWGYAILGYVLYYRISKLNSSYQLLLGKVAFVLGSISTFLFTYYFSRQQQAFDSTHYHYLTLNVCMQAIGAFLWLKNYTINWGVLEPYKKHISIESYGIYLSHVLVIWILNKMYLNIFSWNAWFMIPLLSILTIVGSLQLLKLMRKIPFLDKFRA